LGNSSTIGIVVTAHAGLAEGLIQATNLILGEQTGLRAFSLTPDIEDPKALLAETIEVVNQGDGVLVLTDLFGGTPANLAIALSQDAQIEVITGVNLPMLMRALAKRDTLSLSELVDELIEYTRQQILAPAQLLASREADSS